MASVHEAVASNGSHNWIALLFGGLAFMLIGCLNFFKPDLGYRMRRWQYKNPEALAPSDASLRWGRVTGVVAMVVGVMLMVVAVSR